MRREGFISAGAAGLCVTVVRFEAAMTGRRVIPSSALIVRLVSDRRVSPPAYTVQGELA